MWNANKFVLKLKGQNFARNHLLKVSIVSAKMISLTKIIALSIITWNVTHNMEYGTNIMEYETSVTYRIAAHTLCNILRNVKKKSAVE